jgi:uncharacterized protein YuzE
MTMQLEYDLNVGALYIRLSDAEVAQTHEAGDNAAVDLDAAGAVVGIEVISAAHQWPLADILATYTIPANEAAQLKSYFVTAKGLGFSLVRQAAAKISIASPAPAKALAAA